MTADLDPEEFRRLGHRMVDWVADHRAGLAELPVRPAVPPGWVTERLPAALPAGPQPLESWLAALDGVVVPGSTHWQHPGFFAYFPANASLASLLGEIASGGLGAQGMLWSTSPACTEVEQHLLDLLADELGPGPASTFAAGGGGVVQDSASSSALVALLAGLHRATPTWRTDGVDGRETVYVTGQTHSSLAKAVRVAGLGSRALREVPTAPGTLAMDPGALAAMLDADVAAGRRPVLVCATVGTTGTGAVDPVDAIADACAAHGPWLHVDAAWGGAAALLPEHRALFAGVERADSYCVDAHKWLLTAFDASLMWTRHGTALPAALSIAPEYLRNAASEAGAVVDYRDWQVPLGRRFRALKLWAVLHTVGLDGLRAHVRTGIALAGRLAERVAADPRFATPVPPSLGLVCLQVVTGAGPAADDAASAAVLAAVNDTGRALLSHTVVDGRYVIRVAVGGVATRAEHVDALWEELCAARATVLAERTGVAG